MAGKAKHGVILIHGIGDQGPDWALHLADELRRQAKAQAAVLLGEAATAAHGAIAVEPVYWADLLQERQRHLFQLLAAHQSPVRLEGNPLRRLWNHAKYWLRRAERKFAAEFVGDVVGYLDPSAREAIHTRIDEGLEALAALVETDDGVRPLTVVAHSLGTVAASDYLRTRAAARRARQAKGFHKDWRLENFFTIGSPLALFSLRYGGPEIFTDPVAIEGPRGRWVNIFDKDDPVAMPIKALNQAYNAAVLRDVQVDSGDYLLAHNGYFTHAGTLKIIVAKVALDAVASGGRLSAERLKALYAAYDQDLGL